MKLDMGKNFRNNSWIYCTCDDTEILFKFTRRFKLDRLVKYWYNESFTICDEDGFTYELDKKDYICNKFLEDTMVVANKEQLNKFYNLIPDYDKEKSRLHANARARG